MKSLMRKMDSMGDFKLNEKIQKKAYTLDDVVGTVGGFIGLFLGYALIQVPDLTGKFCILFKNSIKQIS